MRQINKEKLSMLINDTILHRQCDFRSGKYLATYLYKHGQIAEAQQLMARCLVHDISKLEDIGEFIALASIVEQIGDLKNITHKSTEQQKQAMSLHHANNDHHPEYYKNHNEMQPPAMDDMAVDLHARSKQMGTNPLDYFHYHQGGKYHFDKEHFIYIDDRLKILTEAAKEDNYLDIFNTSPALLFITHDPLVAHLENFYDTCYDRRIETERLILDKSIKSNYSAVSYTIKLKNSEKIIGEITILCNGKIYYRLYNKYRGNDYIKEVLLKFKSIIKRKELSLEIGSTNLFEQQIVSDLGFVSVGDFTEGIRTFKFTKGK